MELRAYCKHSMTVCLQTALHSQLARVLAAHHTRNLISLVNFSAEMEAVKELVAKTELVFAYSRHRRY